MCLRNWVCRARPISIYADRPPSDFTRRFSGRVRPRPRALLRLRSGRRTRRTDRPALDRWCRSRGATSRVDGVQHSRAFSIICRRLLASSAASTFTWPTTPKAAVRLMTKLVAVQHAKDKIRANSVHPGIMPPMRTSGRTADPAVRAERMRVIPMRRPGEVDEVAYTILFLASDESSYITGSEIHVDGGAIAI